jgi:hypothetical protein
MMTDDSASTAPLPRALLTTSVSLALAERRKHSHAVDISSSRDVGSQGLERVGKGKDKYVSGKKKVGDLKVMSKGLFKQQWQMETKASTAKIISGT